MACRLVCIKCDIGNGSNYVCMTNGCHTVEACPNCGDKDFNHIVHVNPHTTCSSVCEYCGFKFKEERDEGDALMSAGHIHGCVESLLRWAFEQEVRINFQGDGLYRAVWNHEIFAESLEPLRTLLELKHKVEGTEKWKNEHKNL